MTAHLVASLYTRSPDYEELPLCLSKSVRFFGLTAIRPLLTAFQMPLRVDACRAKLNHWRELLESGRADQLNERELLPEFLTAIFGELLGYTGPASGGDHYTMSRETHFAVDGKYADAVLG